MQAIFAILITGADLFLTEDERAALELRLRAAPHISAAMLPGKSVTFAPNWPRNATRIDGQGPIAGCQYIPDTYYSAPSTEQILLVDFFPATTDRELDALCHAIARAYMRVLNAMPHVRIIVGDLYDGSADLRELQPDEILTLSERAWLRTCRAMATPIEAVA